MESLRKKAIGYPEVRKRVRRRGSRAASHHTGGVESLYIQWSNEEESEVCVSSSSELRGDAKTSVEAGMEDVQEKTAIPTVLSVRTAIMIIRPLILRHGKKHNFSGLQRGNC